jgi:four helix bundle protein
MVTIRKFEDIEAWIKARELTNAIYGSSRSGAFSRDYGLKDQIRRSSVSVMSNIAEGFERDSVAEFAKFLSYAKGSVGEVQSQLYVALDQEYVTLERFKEIQIQTDTTKRLIAGFMQYLKHTPFKGNRYH